MYNYLRGRLKQLDIDQAELAVRMGLSQPSISKRFTGQIPWDVEEMYQLMDICRAQPEELHIYFPRGGMSA